MLLWPCGGWWGISHPLWAHDGPGQICAQAAALGCSLVLTGCELLSWWPQKEPRPNTGPEAQNCLLDPGALWLSGHCLLYPVLCTSAAVGGEGVLPAERGAHVCGPPTSPGLLAASWVPSDPRWA